MSSMYFPNTLKNHIKRGLTREQVVNCLTTGCYEEIRGCDSTTLSRWVSGKTKPSLYKQLLVCLALDIDILSFIKGVDTKNHKISMKSQVAFDKYLHFLNNSNNVISYYKRTNNINTYYDLLNQDEHRKLLDAFYHNFSGYIKIRDRLDKEKIAHDCHTYLFKDGAQLCGHISFTEENQNYLDSLGVVDTTLESSIGVTPVFYSDEITFWMVISSFYWHILHNKLLSKTRYATICLRNRSALEFYRQTAGAESLTYIQPEDHALLADRGLFIVKIDLLKFLSKPIVVQHIQEFIDAHSSGSILSLKDHIY
ncbi:helix-turn-helix domain-containing protein [Vibrio owensii]|uniref:helix-turn-helix domain-containing protein n=1 Tax=Vibrio owensii TaxID=696485 RepID=UPI003AABA948